MKGNDTVYRSLKERIVFLDYEPGQALREKELMQEFGVSRTPVREALIRLEAEGLVRIFPNQGTIVADVSFQNLKDVIEIRYFLVRLTAQLAAARITQDELEAMRQLIQRMKSEQGSKVLMRLDSEMHDLINKATKNEMLVKMLASLRDQSVRIWTFSPSGDEYLFNMAEEFEELADALERRDEEECARILEQHSQGFIEHIKSQFTW